MKITCPNCQFEFEQNENQNFKFCPHCGSNMESPGTSMQIEMKQSPSDFCTCWIKRFFSFKGRARRLEFWTIRLSLFVPFFIISLLILIKSEGHFDRDFLGLFWLIIELLLIPLSVRRMHDIGKSGWWLIGLYFVSILVSFIPYIGEFLSNGIVLGFFLQDSKPGDNIYGPNPKGISAK